MSVWPDDYYRKAKGPVTFGDKINPFWWCKNTDDPVEGVDWYLPDKPLWFRRIRWFIRNPFPNFRRYVIGFWDKQNVWGPERWKNNPPGWNGSDTMWPLPEEKFCFYFPFVSYTIFGFKGYVGWKPNGEFGGPSLRKI